VTISIVKPAYAATPLSDFYAPGAAMGTGVTMGDLISPLIQNASILLGLLFFGILIYAGIIYISASGDSKRIEQAQKMLTYGIAGVLLSFAAYWITKIAFTVFGNNLF
jgi:hypothetical protein